MIWKQDITLEKLNAMGATNLGGHLGMEFVEIGPDYLIARMPVDHRTKQPFGLLHGGASAALAETIVDADRVGLDFGSKTTLER